MIYNGNVGTSFSSADEFAVFTRKNCVLFISENVYCLFFPFPPRNGK